MRKEKKKVHELKTNIIFMLLSYLARRPPVWPKRTGAENLLRNPFSRFSF